MQRARDQFLARTRFAIDQHRCMRLSEPADGAKHLLHGRALAEDFRGVLRDFRHVVLPEAFLQCAPDQVDRMVHVERLRQILEGPALEGSDGALEIRVRSHDDHRQRRKFLLHFLQQLEPRTAGHADVAHHDLRRGGAERQQRFLRRSKCLERDILARECFFKHPAD